MALPLSLINWLGKIGASARVGEGGKPDYHTLSQHYKAGKRTPPEAAHKISYLIARFPATFAAIERILREIPAQEFQSHLDIGAGPGTVSAAVAHLGLKINTTLLVEADAGWVRYQKEIAAILEQKEWPVNLTEWDSKTLSGQNFDLVTCAYAAIEMITDLLPFIKNLWDLTKEVLVILEPGTPSGYQNILAIRTYILSQGGHIMAPCPHAHPCPLAERAGAWCHFKVRLSRQKMHQHLKGGVLNYEDEKYSYLVACKKPLEASPAIGRLIGHPHQHKGHITVDICEASGDAKQKTISKADQDVYKALRCSEWGDLLKIS